MLNFLAALAIFAAGWWILSKVTGSTKREDAPAPKPPQVLLVHSRSEAGFVDGRHFTEHVNSVKAMRRAGDDDAALGMLLRLMDAVEAEAIENGQGWPLAPWYYEQAAIIYRHMGMYRDEAGVLMRHMKAQAGQGVAPDERITKRHARAVELAIKPPKRAGR